MSTPVFAWPAQTDQVRVTAPYDPATGSIGIHAPRGTPVRASIKGTVSSITSDSLQLAGSQHTIVYSGLQGIRVKPGAAVTAGEVIAESGTADSIRLVVLQVVDPTGLFDMTPPVQPQPKPAEPAPAAPPTPARDEERIYLRPTTEGLRLREQPVDGKPVGQLKLFEIIESLEPAAETRRKIGVNDQWLKIRRADGTEAYCAAWFLQITEKPRFSGSLTGMNLDIDHPLGAPDPQAMQGIGWVRLKFNVSLNPQRPMGDPKRYGNTDIEATYKRYLPHIQKYHAAGMKVLLVFSHQLYGEGAGFDWRQMNSERWGRLIATYADFARQVAQRFAGTGLISVYQIWNEQDTREGRAAVAVPAHEYGRMLTESIRAIRSADPHALVITGGHTSGPDAGSQYIRQAFSAMPADIRPDGIAFHPYGRGKAGHRFSNWGPLEEEVRKYGPILPDKQLWITEWGVLDHQGRTDVIPDVTDYATSFMALCKQDFAGRIAAAMWYAWADSMDNGFGLVDSSGRPKPTLCQRFCTLG